MHCALHWEKLAYSKTKIVFTWVYKNSKCQKFPFIKGMKARWSLGNFSSVVYNRLTSQRDPLIKYIINTKMNDYKSPEVCGFHIMVLYHWHVMHASLAYPKAKKMSWYLKCWKISAHNFHWDSSILVVCIDAVLISPTEHRVFGHKLWW